LSKIEIFVKNRNFCQKSKFLSKIQTLTKHLNFNQKSQFLSKIAIFVKNRIFLSKTETLTKHRNFCQQNRDSNQKSEFCLKTAIFVKKMVQNVPIFYFYFYLWVAIRDMFVFAAECSDNIPETGEWSINLFRFLKPLAGRAWFFNSFRSGQVDQI